MKYLNWFLYVGLLLVSSATTAHGAISLRDCALSASPAAPEPIVSEASGATYLRLSADGKNVERCDYRSDNHLEHAVFALYFARKAVVYVGFPLFAEYELKEAYPTKGRHALNYQKGKYRDNRDYTQSRGKCE